MKVLVLNAGSSSLKFGIFDLGLTDSRIFKAEFSRFSDTGGLFTWRTSGKDACEQTIRSTATTLADAVQQLPALLAEYGHEEFDAVGHRVVHGGARFHGATLIDDSVEQAIGACAVLAPLHNPIALAAIRQCRALWPALPQVAVFDTAFHQTVPAAAHTYAVPKAWRDRGLRRYGFHGTSHHYVALRAAEALHKPLHELRLVSCHLGNGASVCAIAHGHSIDTSMGMTPMEGLVMGSRSGDIDPGAFSFLGREFGLDAAAVEQALNTESGLVALAGTNDMEAIEAQAATGNADAQLTLQLYAYRVRKYIGAYAAAMGGIDAVIFTGGIGENSADMRRRICERLGFLGLWLDVDRNCVQAPADYTVVPVHTLDSRVQVLVTRTNEQCMIARETAALLQHAGLGKKMLIPVAVSARHVHLSQAAVEALFGKDHQLQLEHQLSQPDGWAAKETVTLVGPKGSFANVRVLGPTRSATQIEVSRTDTFTLGVDAPLRPSGQLADTPAVTLRGPNGDHVTNGLIVAARHLHMSPADADTLHLRDGDFVDIKVGSDQRAVDFTHTLVRVKPGFVTEMHIDTDEANAAGIAIRSTGELVLNEELPNASVTTHHKAQA